MFLLNVDKYPAHFDTWDRLVLDGSNATGFSVYSFMYENGLDSWFWIAVKFALVTLNALTTRLIESALMPNPNPNPNPIEWPLELLSPPPPLPTPY